MSQHKKTAFLIWAIIGCCTCLPAAPIEQKEIATDKVQCTVQVEEVVTQYTPANNGAGPLWCYGSTVIARQACPERSRRGEDIYLSVIETGKDVPPLCNTRWQLWRRNADGWKLMQTEKEFRQREPCPIAIFEKGPIFLSVNPSIEPAGTQYGRCQPLVLEFDPQSLDRTPRTHEPIWADPPEADYFTDHSYRGFAADGTNRELLLLNINAKTGEQFVSYRDRQGSWHQKGKIKFPIRACYPQVALRDGCAAVLAIGDIVEPVEQWRKLKFEKLKSQWDYVFRRLFYTCTDNIRTIGFSEPIEIDTVEHTCGHIQNLDLHIDQAGTAHLLYLKRPHQYAFIRDKYFPGEPMTAHLEYVAVKAGKVVLHKTLVETSEGPPPPLPQGRGSSGLEPTFARFHVGPDDELYAIVAGTELRQKQRGFGNYIGRIPTDSATTRLSRIDLGRPFHNFFTNTPRGGSKPSDVIDLFGIADDSPNLRYARIRLQSSGG